MNNLHEVILSKFGVSMCRKIIVVTETPISEYKEFLESIRGSVLYSLLIKRIGSTLIFDFGDIVFLKPDEDKLLGYRADLIIIDPYTRVSCGFLGRCYMNVMGDVDKVIVLQG